MCETRFKIGLGLTHRLLQLGPAVQGRWRDLDLTEVTLAQLVSSSLRDGLGLTGTT